MSPKRLVAPSLAVILIGGAAPAATARLHRPGAPVPAAQAGGWASEVTNTYFPLPPGTTFHYEGTTDGIPTTDDMIVTHNTKQIAGVTCIEVHDVVSTNGIVSEDTLDWYAQDSAGNVWYFGEDTKELDASGNVISTEGSWLAGIAGAQQGVIMEAAPRVGDKYRQEFSAGVAEDMAQVLSLNKSTCVRYGCFDDLLLTKETSPLEKGVTEHKWYAPGVGNILVDVVKGGSEHSELVSVTGGH